jgi:signal transduction histidine kinase
MTIEDNGIGFDIHTIKKGVGLKNIQNRIYLLNGNYTIDTAPGKGCRIFIKFPLNKQTSE